MADFVNPSTLQLARSVNDMPSPWVVCTRANLDAWETIAPRYRKWVTDHIEEMTAPEKAAADAAALSASRDSVAGVFNDFEQGVRAFMLVALDELNLHADKMNAILTAIDNGTTLATVKSNIAAIADYPQRTATQLRNAIRGKLGS